jgi:heme/copper-type cytochrome/quinol oxidase subunit 3
VSAAHADAFRQARIEAVRATGELPARPTAWWAMLLVIATEATLFALLLASYFYLQARTPGAWPPDGIKEPTLLLPGIMTVLLFTSSIPMFYADRKIRRGDIARLRLGLVVTFVLGVAFLVVQAFEYREDLREFRVGTDAYGSSFYTITGLHGMHVVAGLLLIAWTLFRARRGIVSRRHHVGVEVTALYWHFVHLAWLVIFTSLYVVPHL